MTGEGLAEDDDAAGNVGFTAGLLVGGGGGRAGDRERFECEVEAAGFEGDVPKTLERKPPLEGVREVSCFGC